jgi:hypothetical protein
VRLLARHEARRTGRPRGDSAEGVLRDDRIRLLLGEVVVLRRPGETASGPGRPGNQFLPV